MSASPFVLETGSRVSCFRLVASLVAWVTVKNPPAMQEIPGSLEDPLEKGLATHSTSLPGEFHRQRSLAGYSPWGCKESDVTEQLTLDFQYCAGHLGGCKEVKGMLSSSKE